MKNKNYPACFALLIIGCLPFFLLGVDDLQPVPAPSSSPVVQYTIDAQLIPEMRKLMATQVLIWINTSTVPVDHLRFHLYYNGFRNEKTTFFTESGYFKKSPAQIRKLKFGEIIIKEIEIPGGEILTDRISYISPDDGNEDDRTVMELPLPKPIAPGESLSIKMVFQLTIPQIFHRTGCEEDYYFLGQWFPKIGVLQKDGQWNCHQFHSTSEFFADYGVYRVKLSVPEKYVVGATGNLQKREKNADGTITYLFTEKNIHDFAWTAFPGFKRITQSIQLKGNPKPTTIELLLSPHHESGRERYLQAITFALNFFAEHIYPYPYNKMTVVDPPLNAAGSGGMEYPGLITGNHFEFIPSSFKLTELVTIHEFAHQYWYGIVGSDEFREAWLDEGLTSFFEWKIMSAYQKKPATAVESFPFDLGVLESFRVKSNLIIPVDRVNQYSWKYLNSDQYYTSVYSRASVFLISLQNLVGKERMLNFFKFYAEKYKYGHPTTDDFIETFQTFMDEDFSWAFEQFINGETILNHSVFRVDSTMIRKKPLKYRNEAVFMRKEGYFPVELMIKLEDGRELKSFWREKEKWKRIVIYDTSPIRYAVIDPSFKVPLDCNYLDNSKLLDSDKPLIKRISLKAGFWFQNVLSIFLL